MSSLTSVLRSPTVIARIGNTRTAKLSHSLDDPHFLITLATSGRNSDGASMSHNANEQGRFRTDPHGVGLSARMAVESAPEYVSVPRFAQFPLGRGLYNGILALVLWFRSVFLGSGSAMPGRGASRAWSLLTLLLVYGVLAILPMLAAGGYLLFRLAQAERAQLEERVHQIAEAVAGDVDRELERRLTVFKPWQPRRA